MDMDKDIHAYMHARTHECRHAGIQACRHAGMHTNRHAGTHVHRHTLWHKGTHACKNVCTHILRPVALQTRMIARSHIGTQAHRGLEIAHASFPLASIRKKEIVFKARTSQSTDKADHKVEHCKRPVM